jgi:hypothetical protein
VTINLYAAGTLVASFLSTNAFIVQDNGGWFATLEGLARLQDKPGIASWLGMNGPGTQYETPAETLVDVLILGVAWANAVTVFGIVWSGLMIMVYALPFRQAVEGAAAGEMALALGVGFFLVLTGALAPSGRWRSCGVRVTRMKR